MTKTYCSICAAQEPNKDLREWAIDEDGLCEFHQIAPGEKTDAGFLVCGEDRKVIFVTHRQYLVGATEFRAASAAAQKISEGGRGATHYVSRSTIDGAQDHLSRPRFSGGFPTREQTRVEVAEMPLARVALPLVASPLVARTSHVDGGSKLEDEGGVGDSLSDELGPPPQDDEEEFVGASSDHKEVVAAHVEQDAPVVIECVPQVPQAVAQLSSASAGEKAWRSVLDRARKAFSTAYYEPSLDPRRIRPMKGQPRTIFNQDRLKRLRESILQVGQIQPIVVRRVRDDEVHTEEIVDGERRWQACMDGEAIPMRAMVVDVDDEAAQYVISIVANFNREGHTPLESSDAIVRMHENLGVPMKDIAEMFGKSTLWVYQRYGLRRLVPDVRSMLDEELPPKEQLSVMAAINISGLVPERQLEVAVLVRAGKLNVNNIRDLAAARGNVVSYGRVRRPSDVVDGLIDAAQSFERIAQKLRVAVSATSKDQLHASSQLKVTRFRRYLEGALDSIEQVKEDLKGTSFATKS